MISRQDKDAGSSAIFLYRIFGASEDQADVENFISGTFFLSLYTVGIFFDNPDNYQEIHFTGTAYYKP